MHSDTFLYGCFGVLPIFKKSITCFVFLSLSGVFFILVDSLLLVQVKHKWFDFQQVFIIKIEFLEWKTWDKNLQTQ